MICADETKGILACIFYEGVGQEWISKDLLFTAHKEGVVRVSLNSPPVETNPGRFGVDMFARVLSLVNRHGS